MWKVNVPCITTIYSVINLDNICQLCEKHDRPYRKHRFNLAYSAQLDKTIQTHLGV